VSYYVVVSYETETQSYKFMKGSDWTGDALLATRFSDRLQAFAAMERYNVFSVTGPIGKCKRHLFIMGGLTD